MGRIMAGADGLPPGRDAFGTLKDEAAGTVPDSPKNGASFPAAAPSTAEPLLAEHFRHLNLEERDPVTGLANRRGFAIQMAELLLSDMPRCPGALVLLEFTNFNEYNIVFGSRRGDELLKLAGDIVSKIWSNHLMVRARIGEATFALGVGDLTLEEVQEFGQILHHSLALRLSGEDFSGYADFRCGGAYFQRKGTLPALLVTAKQAISQSRNRLENVFELLQCG
jgi:GGDEF domain-containing protein